MPLLSINTVLLLQVSVHLPCYEYVNSNHVSVNSLFLLESLRPKLFSLDNAAIQNQHICVQRNKLDVSTVQQQIFQNRSIPVRFCRVLIFLN